jgi:predicted transcriptional regulator
MELADMCKEVREALAISQRELAMMIGSNQTEISFIERGFTPSDTAKVNAIIEEYNKLQGCRNSVWRQTSE